MHTWHSAVRRRGLAFDIVLCISLAVMDKVADFLGVPRQPLDKSIDMHEYERCLFVGITSPPSQPLCEVNVCVAVWCA